MEKGELIEGTAIRLHELLGSGGYADVFSATDEGPLDRDCAVKVLRGEQGARRWLAEVQALGALQHPNIVQLYGHSQPDSESRYLVLELLEGETLRAQMDRLPRIDVHRGVDILRSLLRALGHAHSRGVKHCDIKPENVFITDDEQLKLADFGLALIGDDGGAPRGTPAYMAPELASEGNSVRSDLYAVGVVSFEVFEGQAPGGEAQEAQEAPELKRKNVPHTARRLVQRLLSHDPFARPKSAGEALRLLEEAKVEQPIRATGNRTRRPLVVGGALVAAALAIVSAYLLRQTNAGPAPTTAAEAPALEAGPTVEPTAPKADRARSAQNAAGGAQMDLESTPPEKPRPVVMKDVTSAGTSPPPAETPTAAQDGPRARPRTKAELDALLGVKARGPKRPATPPSQAHQPGGWDITVSSKSSGNSTVIRR